MPYNNGVLVGNWSEERLKNEYDFKIFLRKRDRHDLILQKSRTLFSNLLKEKPLAISGNFVMFGYNVQVVAPDMPSQPLVKCDKKQYGLALSVLVTARQVDFAQNISDGCMMTLSPILTPCCRNTFVLISTDDERSRGDKVNYGDEFYLRAENYGNPEAEPLYVRYTTSSVPEPADRMGLSLSSLKDACCRFTALPLRTEDYLEQLGNPVTSNHRLVIRNCVADLNLCVMNQSWMHTFFGTECGVTCRNYKDVHKRFTAENVFTLISDVPTN